jgi:hypothetical protein
MGRNAGVIVAAMVFCFVYVSMAQQGSEFLLTNIPIGVRNASDTLTIRWTGGKRAEALVAPDSGYIYFSRNPGGKNLANYSARIVPLEGDNNRYLAGFPPQRQISFVPSQQPAMGYGVFNCIIALPTPTDTLFSESFEVIVQTPQSVVLESPVKSTDDLTPTFKWKANQHVPYYHIILSDEELNLADTTGLSIVWQAITPGTEIVYGSPDPSGTLTADPPPLSPGQRYTWTVLNNYGNNMLYTSYKISIPAGFTVGGKALKSPKNEYPAPASALNSVDNQTIRFKWSNLDPLANTYKIYLYISSDFEGLDAKMVVWQGEVTAGGFENDTGYMDVDAKTVLASNNYKWKVFAVDQAGGGTSGEITDFFYSSPMGVLQASTKEIVQVGSSFDTVSIGLVQMRAEVLQGSMQAPLAFGTDLNGVRTENLPAGAYRITAFHDRYESVTKTVTISENSTTPVVFYLQRPVATILGQVVDQSLQGVNLALVKAVSERGDTISDETDPRGFYQLNCYDADWTLWVEKNGFETALPIAMSVGVGQSYQVAQTVLKRNPISLSGVVTNPSGVAIMGAQVIVLRDGVGIDTLAKTAQNGSFAFSVSPGTYTLVATRTGFTNYTQSHVLSSSKQLSVVLSPGAALVSGYVFGRSYIGSTVNTAAIQNASVRFIPLSGSGEITTTTHFQYGDFQVSLPGDGSRYLMVASAAGYQNDTLPDTLTTEPSKTFTRSLTLQAYGYISGQAVSSSNGQAIKGISITLMGSGTAKLYSNATSSADGSFEIDRVVDGSYVLQAGAVGWVLDSITPNPNLTVSAGQVGVSTYRVYLSAGTKDIRWVINNGEDNSSVIKVQSPLQKSLNVSQRLQGVGAGSYVVSVDAVHDSVIDLSYHSFAVGVSDTLYVDSVQLPLWHSAAKSLLPLRDTLSLKLLSRETVDSAEILYKDIGASSFSSQRISLAADSFTFSFRVPKDGSTMQYYFRVWVGTNVYGYSQELYSSYIIPDSKTLSKYEVVPLGKDTVQFSSNTDIRLSLKGYYGSNFAPADDALSDNSVSSWRLLQPQGCTWIGGDSTGLEVILRTASQQTTQPVQIEVTLDTQRIGFKQGVNPVDTFFLNVSGKKLDKIIVRRVDNETRVTNDSLSQAEFGAIGVDAAGNEVALSPNWSVLPPVAGTINVRGLFQPAPKFFGRVRILATVGALSGEYVKAGEASDKPGMDVLFLLSQKSTPDTATNGQGCTIYFPDSIVSAGEYGMITLQSAVLQNQLRRSSGTLFVAGAAYSINELNGVKFTVRNQDSIALHLDVVDDVTRKAITGGKASYYIGLWDTAQLVWQELPNTVVDNGGRWLRANLAHFSEYAIVGTGGELSASMTISPNPFSPFTLITKGNESHYGTRIQFSLDGEEARLRYAWIRIYSIGGELVYSVRIPNPAKRSPDGKPYELWWDGKTTNGRQDLQVTALESHDYSSIRTERLCRNGRYTVVLTISDTAGKEKNYVKPVVLFK